MLSEGMEDPEQEMDMDRRDYDKLCNDYVWDGTCRWESRCKFKHKKLCKMLINNGECTKQRCEDGHNVEGVCRYHNQGGCKFHERKCRYLHIKLRKMDQRTDNRKKVNDNEEIKRWLNQEMDERREEEEKTGNGGCCMVLPLVTPKDAAKSKKVNSEEAGKDGCLGDEEFQTDDEEILAMEETRNEEEKTDRRGHCLALPLVTPRDEVKTRKKDEKKGEQNECKSVKNPEQEQMIDRDLTGFLGLNHKHDVWKEIKATKAEVKKLEKEVTRHRRKAQGGRNL